MESHLRRISSAICVLGLLNFAGAPAPTTPPYPPSKTVILIGDSITANAPAGYVATYGQRLQGYLGWSWGVHNAACGGTTTENWSTGGSTIFCGEQIYQNFAEPFLPRDVAVVMLGTNDFNETVFSITVAEYEFYLLDIIDRLLSDGVGKVVLMTPPPVPHVSYGCDSDPPYSGTKLLEIRNVVLNVCQNMTNVMCGPDVHELLKPASTYFPTCATPNHSLDVHPKAKGHTAIVMALSAFLKANFP